MKKIIVYLLTSCLFLTFGLTPAFADNIEDIEIMDEDFQNFIPSVDDRVINVLKENNIEFFVEDGYLIKLKNPIPGIVNHANYLLERSMNNGILEDKVSLAANYPTPWYDMPSYTMISTKKFNDATKWAFSGTMLTWLQNKTASASTLATVAAATFGSYYFLNTSVEEVYYISKYYYRELGPGSFGPTGSFMGDYEIRKIERTTKSHDGTGGQTHTRHEKSTIIEPFF